MAAAALRAAWRPTRQSSSVWRKQQITGACFSTQRETEPPVVSLAELFARVEEGPSSSSDDNVAEGPVHVVESLSSDPYANLAVEQRLLERAHPLSRVLFLYRNTPCVVIGRNQNPWAEVALTRLGGVKGNNKKEHVELVRRRSGGGAVYHDAGNANWSVLVPGAGFDRDRHAKMVAAALRKLGVASARVNERHDIVVSDGEGSGHEKKDSERSEDQNNEQKDNERSEDQKSEQKDNERSEDKKERKVSGSAYKLTRGRALHHGTCLLGTDLAAVGGLLRSPTTEYLQAARGVASVRSPVQNVATEHDEKAFAEAVIAGFLDMYGEKREGQRRDQRRCRIVTDDAFQFDPRLAKGYAELRSADWMFGQTPQFGFSTDSNEQGRQASRPTDVPDTFGLTFTARHGVLQDVVVRGTPSDKDVAKALEGRKLYSITDWQQTLGVGTTTANWLNDLFGVNVLRRFC